MRMQFSIERDFYRVGGKASRCEGCTFLQTTDSNGIFSKRYGAEACGRLRLSIGSIDFCSKGPVIRMPRTAEETIKLIGKLEESIKRLDSNGNGHRDKESLKIITPSN